MRAAQRRLMGAAAVLAFCGLAAPSTAAEPALRQTPNILLPNESRMALVRLRLPALVFDNELAYLETLKGAPNDGHKNGEDYPIEWVETKKLKGLQGVKPAEQLDPIRAAEVVAAFPLKAQVQEFQDKLSLKSPAAVLAEKSQQAGPGPAPSDFRFLGVRVERRQWDGRGAAVTDWAPLDFQGTYEPFLFLCGGAGRLPEEAARLKPAVFPGLVMPKLPTFGDRLVPPLDEYPKLEGELRTLKAALDAPKAADEPGPPDACLIRFFDVTVEPGKTYEYRLQVRMANPNFGRTDAAASVDTKGKELAAKDWYVVPQKLAVPTDLHLYAVDQRALDLKGLRIIGDPQNTELPGRQEQAILQIHRWMDYVQLSNRTDRPVGDWVVAERVAVYRGEVIGRQRAEVPYWRTAQDRFTLASDPSPKLGEARKAPLTVEVSFFHEGEEPIVVDFHGGHDQTPEVVLLYTADGKLLAHSSAVDAADPDRIQRLDKVRDWLGAVRKQNAGKQTKK